MTFFGWFSASSAFLLVRRILCPFPFSRLHFTERNWIKLLIRSVQPGNLKLHFPLFLCLIYFEARKGDFLAFPFCLHLSPFLYIGLAIHFTPLLLALSCLATGHSFKDSGIQIPFCSVSFLLQLLLPDTAGLVLPSRLQSAGSWLSYYPQFLCTNSHLPLLLFQSLPHVTIAGSPRTPNFSAGLLFLRRWLHSDTRTAVLRACDREKYSPVFLGEYPIAWGSVSVCSAENTNTQPYRLQQLCGFLIQVLLNPKPALPCQTPGDVAPGDTATNSAHTSPTRPCLANTRGFTRTSRACADTKQNKWKLNSSVYCASNFKGITILLNFGSVGYQCLVQPCFQLTCLACLRVVRNLMEKRNKAHPGRRYL